MQNIFLHILPIFGIILLGSIIKHKWITAIEFWRGLEKLSYFLLFPTVLFNYISQANLSSSLLLKLVFALIIASSLVAAALIYYQNTFHDDSRVFTSIFQGSVRYNSYIFIGIGDALYGNEGLEIIAVISAYMIIFTNIISVLIFNYYIKNEEDESGLEALINLFRKFSTNPLIIASLLGFMVNYAGIDMNIGIKKLLSSLSDSALAMCVLCVGAGLKFSLGDEYSKQILTTTFVKLIMMPMVTFLVFTLFGIGGLPQSVGILFSALPCAGSSFILSRQLGGDPESMASIISLTIMFSVFSIPLIMYIFA